MPLFDLARTTSEQSNNWLGYSDWTNKSDYDFHFQGSFEFPNSPVRYRDKSNQTWRQLGTPIYWQNWRPYRLILPAGTDPYSDIIAPSYCYTVEQTGTHTNWRAVHTFDPNAVPLKNGAYNWLDTTAQKTDGSARKLWRVHFFAGYGTGTYADRIEYVGSSSFWGDGRGIQPGLGRSYAENEARAAGGTALPAYIAPPSRSIT
jgi:hypothetical protein